MLIAFPLCVTSIPVPPVIVTVSPLVTVSALPDSVSNFQLPKLSAVLVNTPVPLS